MKDHELKLISHSWHLGHVPVLARDVIGATSRRAMCRDASARLQPTGGKSTPSAVLSNLDLELAMLPAWVGSRHETNRGCGRVDGSTSHTAAIGGSSWARASLLAGCGGGGKTGEQERRAHGLGTS
jgi:hypothetical protein